MKKLFFLLLIPLATVFSIRMNAQCAAAGSVTTTTTTTANTCAGNGTITATFSNAINTTIQLIKGGTILQSVVAPTSPYTFTNLQPGTDYQIKTVCSIDNSIVYSNSSNITVANNYVAITNAAISVTNVCTSFTPGGTITVNGVTGGTAPYQYSIILNNSPGYDDTLSSYSTPASAPPYTKTLTAFGTYQIRIKDACGGFSTFTRTIAPTVDPVRLYWRSKEICGSTQVEGSLWYLANGLTNGNATESDYLPAPGIKLKIQADNAAGAVLFDGFYTGTYFTYTPSASHMYYVTATNACGASVSYTHDFLNPNGNPEFLNFFPSTSTTGCGASETETLSINFGDQYYWRFPLTIVVKNSAGVIVNPSAPIFNGNIWTLGGLPLDTYTITVSDSCSPANSLTKTINSPVAAGAPVLSLYQKTKWRCEGGALALTQTGTVQGIIAISGYLPDSNNAVVTITAGPSNVGVNATRVDDQYWGWTNLTVGTYTVSYTSCGVPHTGTFTISSNTDVLDQSLSSTAVSTCNSGGSISSNLFYDGAYSSAVELLDIAGTVIDSNATGNFSNLPAGTYTTRLSIQPCLIPSTYYYIPGSTVIITNSSTGASIGYAVGVICEDASGNPLTTGSAYIDLNGVAPYTVTYRVQGSGSAYTTINTSSSSIQINNLTANTIYEVNLSDACGTNANTTIQIKTMGNLAASNTAQPCNGSPYALTMPYYAGATYQWTNPSGAIVSNTRVYNIANYDNSYNGTYVCKITWSSCVTRFVNVTLNSALCGGSIGNCGTVDSDGDTVFDFCDLDDDNDGILDSNEQTCLSPISIGIAPTNTAGATASESYGGTTATYTNVIGYANMYSFGGYNGFDPYGYPSKLKIDYSVNLINYAFRISDLDNLEKVRVLVYDKNGVLVPNIVQYITYKGANVLATAQSGMSVLVESNTNAGGAGNSFNSNIYIDFKLPFEVSRIDFDFYDRSNGSPEYYFLGGCVAKDTDGDTIPDYLDLDSDNDGCVDAMEGGAAITTSQLATATGTVTVGTGSTASNQNLGNTIDTNGVPTLVSGGQSAGDSANTFINSCFCYKSPTTTGTTLPTKHGITALGRAGSEASNGNWPMIRNGAWTVLEAKTKGFVINRITTTAAVNAIPNPVEGMMVYDAEADCLKINTDGTATGWKCFNTQTCP